MTDMTIPGVPAYLPREQYIALFEAVGLDPHNTRSLEMLHDGVRAVVFALDESGSRILGADGYEKHHVFIPVRDAEEDK